MAHSRLFPFAKSLLEEFKTEFTHVLGNEIPVTNLDKLKALQEHTPRLLEEVQFIYEKFKVHQEGLLIQERQLDQKTKEIEENYNAYFLDSIKTLNDYLWDMNIKLNSDLIPQNKVSNEYDQFKKIEQAYGIFKDVHTNICDVMELTREHKEHPSYWAVKTYRELLDKVKSNSEKLSVTIDSNVSTGKVKSMLASLGSYAAAALGFVASLIVDPLMKKYNPVDMAGSFKDEAKQTLKLKLADQKSPLIQFSLYQMMVKSAINTDDLANEKRSTNTLQKI